MTLLKKDPFKEDVIDNFRLFILLKASLKILVKVLDERLILAIEKLVEKLRNLTWVRR